MCKKLFSRVASGGQESLIFGTKFTVTCQPTVSRVFRSLKNDFAS